MPNDVHPTRIRLQGGGDFALEDAPAFKRMAMYWANVVRNRVRWSKDAEALQNVRRTAVHALRTLGIDEDRLRAIAAAGAVEVDIPFIAEEAGWEARILPWEFLLSTATDPYRGPRELVVARRLNRPAPAPVRNPPQTLATIASLPGELRTSGYTFDSELALVQSNLGLTEIAPSDPVHQDPTLDTLRIFMRDHSPDVVHLTGIDPHQGYQILATKEDPARRNVDGFFLAGEDGSAVVASAFELARAVNASPAAKPILVCCNFNNSAARTAALLVADGAQAAIGFQDEIDDLLAEEFFTRFYSGWRNLDWDLLRAFRAALHGIRDDSIIVGTGVVLWSALPLLGTSAPPSAHADEDQLTVRRREKAAQSSDSVDLHRDLAVDIVLVPSLNYSLLHNNQSMFSRFRLRNLNRGLAPVRNLRLVVELCVGDQNYPFRYMFDLEAGIKDMQDEIHLPLTSTLLRSLRESIRSVLFVKLSCGQVDVLEKTYPVNLLAIDEWVDEPNLNAFLPSFVLPRDPAVLRVIDLAQRYLMTLADDAAAGFDGYQSVEPHAADPSEGVDLQAWAIWSALCHDLSLSYINPPPTFTLSSQRLRSPSDVVEGKRGTCIDLALLLAACLEYVGIYPVVFLLKGHAFPGYWRSEESRQDFLQVQTPLDPDFSETHKRTSRYPWVELEQSYDEVFELIRRGDIAPLESVWLTQHKGYWEARDAGLENLRNRSEFELMIDVKGARDKGVTPLPMARI